jgi:hypothetical protein
MQQRPQIDEYTRKQLLDNYLRNQQVQSSSTPQFHPSMFQAQASSVFPSAHFDSLSQVDMHSDISSRRSVPMAEQSVNHSIVPSIPVINLSQQPEQPNELPDNISIEDFTTLVQKWIELDNWLKKSQNILKEKRKQKDKLKEVITHYMSKYNIEDLNTSEGKIRCKMQYVKSGVNQKVVKSKIAEFMRDNEDQCNALITKIFNDREKVEKMSLRRIKIT